MVTFGRLFAPVWTAMPVREGSDQVWIEFRTRLVVARLMLSRLNGYLYLSEW